MRRRIILEVILKHSPPATLTSFPDSTTIYTTKAATSKVKHAVMPFVIACYAILNPA